MTDTTKPTPMGGWKTKTSSFLAALGTTLIGLAEGVPDDRLAPWIRFIGIAIDGFAGAFAIWGLGHKMEKSRPVLIQKKKVPYYVHAIDPEELKILEEFRKDKSSKPKVELAPPTIK